MNFLSILYHPFGVVTPHAHVRAGGYVIGCMFVDQRKFLIVYFSNRLTFSNIRGRTSRLIYRPALPLLSPETLSLSSIFLYYNTHLALFVRMDDTITRTNASGKYCHLVNWN